jgi:hypothetical protein
MFFAWLTGALALAQVEARIVGPPIPIEKPKASPEPRFIRFDPQLGRYVARYVPNSRSGDPNAVPVESVIDLPNEGKPILRAKIQSSGESGKIRYEWTIWNDRDAKAALRTPGFSLPVRDSSLACEHPARGRVPIMPVASPVAPAFGPERKQTVETLGGFRFINWFLDSGSEIKPGERREGFRCESQYLPGWVTVLAPAGEEWKPGGDVPQALWDEFGTFFPLETYWSKATTLGPKFPPGASESSIARDFLAGIAGASEFARALRSHLALVARDPAAAGAFEVRPASPAESELRDALRLALPQHFR